VALAAVLDLFAKTECLVVHDLVNAPVLGRSQMHEFC